MIEAEHPATSGAGDDLLARGIARDLPAARYETPAAGYGRLVYTVSAALGPAGEAGADGGGVLFVDIESLGFIGRPLFLIGALRLEAGVPGGGALVQYLARDYSEEEAVLRAFLTEGAAVARWASFNGQSFDLPFLALRAQYHRLAPPQPAAHHDLLPLARRRWGRQLPDCRLQTLEAHICGRRRYGDIPGSRIPDAYHAFVRTGEPEDLLRILRHNAEDLISLGLLWRRLAPTGAEGAEAR